ncbi:immunoglobulin-like domain-containing protein, partial [Clostridium butyricum]|uniref:immunoglobulin-like domain-containing protein n=1 Tax=Clostridium butyricum TaxID=1492 RepID=UPI003466550A
MAAGIFLYILIELTSVLGGRGGASGKELKRAGPGQGETTYEVEISGLDKERSDKKIPVKIPVGERIYSEEEAKKLFEAMKPKLEEQMLGENESLLKIRKNLNLKTSLSDYGIKIRWETDNPDLVDSLGKVHNQQAAETGESVILRALVSDGVHEHTYRFPVMVYPPDRSLQEKTEEEFLTWAQKEDQKQQTEDYLRLPNEYDGQLLTYSIEKDNSHRLFPFLGLFIALLLHAKVNSDKQHLAKKREQQLLLDYSEVVSKLVVYIGAGLTLRNSWERIVAGYDAGVKEGKRGVRPVYEEMM